MVFDDNKRAQTELSRQQVEVEEIKRGVRNAAPPEKTFGDLCDYWIEKRAARKRSQISGRFGRWTRPSGGHTPVARAFDA